MAADDPFVVGVISDTHGMLRPEALDALAGVALIVHAGDVGDEALLTRLASVAPVRAVRGNCDVEPWASRLPRTAMVEVGATWLYALHDLHRLDLEPGAAGVGAIIAGHTHRASQRWADGVLYFNPGSAGARRSSAPATVGRLTVRGHAIDARVIELGPPQVGS